MIYTTAAALSSLPMVADYNLLILFAVLVFIAALVILFCLQKFKTQKQQILLLREQLVKQEKKIAGLQDLEALAPELKKIARLDHDINTPLCAITMSVGRAQKIAGQQNDEVLQDNVRDILNAVSRIGELMQAVLVLKKHPLIANADKRPTVNAGRE